jgi:hypothetical protein
MSLRRQCFWFFGVAMTPCTEIGQRPIAQSTPRQPGNRRGRSSLR